MKRRSFLTMLGLAPIAATVPAVAKTNDIDASVPGYGGLRMQTNGGKWSGSCVEFTNGGKLIIRSEQFIIKEQDNAF